MSRRLLLAIMPCLCVLCLGPPFAAAQDQTPLPGLLQVLKPRSIGPANMSGRVTDVAVYDKEPRIMYVAAAAGGVWKTTNNGTTWQPVFDRQSTASIGAVAVYQQNPDIVWVGAGEANARNSVSSGDGVYRSVDGGKTWSHMGLKETHHIGRVVIHPTNPYVVYVAALGKLWGPNKERGVFKTADGGKTWQHALALDEHTGAIDLAMDAEDPDLLYAAAYQVRRDAFSGGNPVTQTGPKAGLYKTSDGGKTWDKMMDGLPDRPFGRCGLSVHRKNPRIVYAVVQTDKTSVSVQGQSGSKKLDASAGGIFRSEDKGKTWTHLNSLVPRPFYYGQIRVDPSDDQRVYVLGTAFHISKDGGRTFNDKNAAKGTHVDYHAMWINPRDSQHLVLGCDGGVNLSFDRAVTWEHLKNLPITQFYAIGLDMRSPYRVYGGLQDNGSWGAPSATRNVAGITIADWFNILGFDGYYCQPDPDDPDTVYAEGQYAILRRVNVRTGSTKDIKPRLVSKEADTNIRPKPPLNAPAFRFNWCSPILLSPHNSRVVYFGGNHLFRSEDRGDTWAILGPDLTLGKPGPSDYSGHTITTIAESPRKKGLLYVGTDDGKVWVSGNGGQSWSDLSDKIPDVPHQRWITRLECSHFDEATVYLTIDRHRNDDLAPYVFVSTDQGQTWKARAGNLPKDGPVHVIRADRRNPDLLYVGTEHGLYLSDDRGLTWHRQAHLPTVPVHDLALHPRDHDLVIGTHGRGIYVMEAGPVQQLTKKALEDDAFLCDIAPATAYRQRSGRDLGIKAFRGENPTYGVSIWYHFRETLPELPTLSIADARGNVVAEAKGFKDAGLHRLNWRLNVKGTKEGVFNPVAAGVYTVTLRAGDRSLSKTVRVEVDD